MQIRYSKTHEERQKNSIITEYIDSLSISKQFYLRYVPAVTKLYARNYFLSFFLLIILHMQEIAILLSYRQKIGEQGDDYTSYFIQYLNYSLLINLINQAASMSTAKQGIFYFTFLINCFIVGTTLILFIVFAYQRFDIKKIRSLNMTLSFLMSIYLYFLFLPSLKASFIMINQYQGVNVYTGALNIIFSWIIGFFIVLHDYDYSFKERDKLSKRFSYYDLWQFILQGMLPFFLEFSNEDVLTVYSCLYALQKMVVYFFDQTYYNETMCCFYSMVVTYYSATCIMFLLFLISPNSLNFTLLMLLCIPLSYQLGKVIYQYLQHRTFQKCIGVQNLTDLQPNQLDIYIRLLNKNLNFFYEDYIDGGQGIIFENLYINHQVNCDSDDYRCFCHDFRRKDNKLEFDEYIGQDFRKKYVMFYIVNLYELYLKANAKSTHINSVNFAYISFLFEIMKISTKSFNMIYISQQKLIQNNSDLRDLFIQQILMYRIKQEFQHFFSNPTYQNQRLFVMAPILFDENMVAMKDLLKEQLVNTGIFFDYLCQNQIDLPTVNDTARLLYSNLKDLRNLLIYLYDLNPENLELQQYSQHYSNLLEFENSKISYFKSKSRNLSRRMLQPQDKNIQVFSKNSCIVYASLIKKDGLIKKVSNSFGRIYGIENDLIIGKTLNSLIPRGLYNTHDDIISNFKNKGSMSIINKEQRMVFGLNGEGFIIPLLIRLKLENMNDDFGVCSLLTSVNQEKEYLFISNEGQIMDITKRLYNLIFKDISSISDLRKYDIKHLIPLIWGIQEVNEYDKTYYSILVVSQQLIQQQKDTQVQDLKSIQKMQEVVDAISLQDEIYSITFKVSIITTSIGLNFKFVEIEHFKKEDNLQKRRGHISNLKMCLNDILKNDVNIMFKELSDQVTHNQGTQDVQIPANINDLANLDQSHLLNEDIESSFLNYMKSSLQGRVQSSANIDDNSRLSHQHVPKPSSNRHHKNHIYVAGGNAIQQTNTNSISKYKGERQEDYNENVLNVVDEQNELINETMTPRSGQQYMISSRPTYNQLGYDGSLPPTTDRVRLQENNALLTELGGQSTGTHRGIAGNQLPSLLSLQSPVSQKAALINNKKGGDNFNFFPGNLKQNEQTYFPSSPMISPKGEGNFFINNQYQKNNSNHSSPRDNNSGGTQQKHIDLKTNSSDNSDPAAPGNELGQIVIKRHESRSKTENHNDKGMIKKQQIQIIQVDHNIYHQQNQLLKEMEQDDKESRYLRIGSQDNNFRMIKIDNNHHSLGKDVLDVDDHDPINQNEMITSYKALMKMNQNQRQQKTLQINAMIQHQNTSRSLMNYNQEMKLSLEKEGFKKESKETLHLNSKKYSDVQQFEQRVSEPKQSDQENNGDCDDEDLDSNVNEYVSDGRDQKHIHQEITQKIENNNDQSSVHSSNKTSEQSRRKNIIKKIRSNHISSGLKAMVYMGIVAFFVFVAVSVVLYAQNYQSYSQYISDFNKVTEASIMFLDVLSVVKVFSYLGITVNQPYYQTDKTFSNIRLSYYIEQFKDLFSNFIQGDTSQKYFNYLLEVPFEMKLFHVEGSYDYPIIQKNETQILAISQFMYIIQQINEINFDSTNMLFLWTNIHEYKNCMLDMQTLIQGQAQDQFNNISLMQIMMLIIILVITCTLIFTVLPLSVYNIMRCEEILKLFGCFHPEKLQKLVDIIEESVNRLDLIEYYAKMKSYKIQQRLQQEQEEASKYMNSTTRNTQQQRKDFENKKSKRKTKVGDFKKSEATKNYSSPHHNQHSKFQKDSQNNSPQLKENVKQTNKELSKISSGGGNNQQKNQHLPTNETQQQSSSNSKNGYNPHQNQAIHLSQFNKKMMATSHHNDMPVSAKVQIKRQTQKRSRQIASFNNMPRLDLKLISFAMVIIVIMMIPPVLNIVYSNQYMDEGKVTLLERITVLNTIVQVIQNEAAHFNIWLDSMHYDFKTTDKNSLLSYQSLANVTATNAQTVNSLQALLDINQSRRDQSGYDNFYLSILKDNTCNVMVSYASQFDTNSTQTECQNYYSGVMTRGFIIASKTILDDFTNYYTLYSQNLTYVNTVLTEEIANQSIRDLYRSIVFLLDTFDALDGYSQTSQESYNNYINDISLYLFIFYLIVVIVIFFSGWTHVFFKFYNQFDSTKKLLSLFNMNVILENAFLLQFLKNNNFGIK